MPRSLKNERLELLTEFFTLADKWSLDSEELMTLVGDNSIAHYLESVDLAGRPILNTRVRGRLAILLGIGRDIRVFFHWHVAVHISDH